MKTKLFLILLGLGLVVACEFPTEGTVTVKTSCKVKVTYFENSVGALDSVLTVADSVACPKE